MIFLSTRLLCSLYLMAIAVDGARILAIFPIAAKSHFSCGKAVMDSLLAAGHNITVIAPFPPAQRTENYTVIDSTNETFVYINRSPMNQFTSMSLFRLFDVMIDLTEKYCHDVMGLKHVQDILNSREKLFDVMFVEILSLYECFLPLAAKLNIPVIGVTTLRYFRSGDYAIGNFNNPSYIPNEFSRFGKTMNFYDRLMNTWTYLVAETFLYFKASPKLERFRKMYFNDVQLVADKRPSLIFYNHHSSFMPRPWAPNAIEIGGIHVPKEKPLTKEIQSFLDDAKHGVILFTFGSVVRSSSMGTEMLSMFKEVFAEIPQKVVWKFEEKVEGLPDNVLILDWLPQRDILAHKNVKAFISHCGQSGTYEAIYTGVPVIATPLFADQISNAAILEELGVAIHLNVYSMSKQDLRNTLNAIINDTSYSENMKRLSTLFRDRPMTPQQTVVYWTEYVIKHNGALHLQTPIANMSLYQYLLLDVIVSVMIVLSVLMYSMYYLSKKSYIYCKKFAAMRVHKKLD